MPISTAPRKLPTIVPEPPRVLTPPTTAAAIDQLDALPGGRR